MMQTKKTIRAIVRPGYDYGLVSHLPDSDGRPLCAVKLKSDRWKIADVMPETVSICLTCERIKVKQK